MGEASKKKKKGCFCWLLVAVVAALAVAGAVFAFKKTFHHRHHSPAPPVSGQNYTEAPSLALQFFQVQKSGKLVNNNIPWRGDPALSDGSDAGIDLSKGMYDAGDHMKFGFPMAFTATVLSWTLLEYGGPMSAVKQLELAIDALKWITDYLINAHVSENVQYIQVGDPKVDHECWERPETMTEKRPLTQINPKTPGSDVAAETAAAMAAASLVFKAINSTYSNLLLQHAGQLFSFADTYRDIYSVSIPDIQDYYNSTGYTDELLWAASWLYFATGNRSYLNYATVDHGNAFGDWGRPTWFSWDDKRAGTEVLLSRLNFFRSGVSSSGETNDVQKFKNTADAVVCGLLPDSPTATSSRTDGGLLWVNQWDSLQQPVAASFLAVLYSDYMTASRTAELQCRGKAFSPSDIRYFAMSQADYVLGDNPMKLSYVIGYGSSFPQQVHHRGASIPSDANTGCDGWSWLNSTSPNPNIAVGGMVGGPFLNDTYVDIRNNSVQAEPSIYNSAVLIGLLSGLVAAASSVPLSFN